MKLRKRKIGETNLTLVFPKLKLIIKFNKFWKGEPFYTRLGFTECVHEQLLLLQNCPQAIHVNPSC